VETENALKGNVYAKAALKAWIAASSFALITAAAMEIAKTEFAFAKKTLADLIAQKNAV
jgi:hypothetical protein